MFLGDLECSHSTGQVPSSVPARLYVLFSQSNFFSKINLQKAIQQICIHRFYRLNHHRHPSSIWFIKVCCGYNIWHRSNNLGTNSSSNRRWWRSPWPSDIKDDERTFHVDHDSRSFAKQCLQCQRNKVNRHNVTPLPIFAHLHIDIVGPFRWPRDIATVRFTRWPDAFPIPDSIAPTVTKA